jgi:NSS family neurotransmitter:Na+ symporter
MLMPVVAFSTCILVGWVLKPEMVISEVEKTAKRWEEKGFTG